MTNVASHVGRALILLGLGACAQAPADGGAADMAGAQGSRITLKSRAGTGEGVRLADGAVLPAGRTADLTFSQAMVMSLRSPTPESICRKGTFAALAEVPADVNGCPSNPDGWAQIAYLDAATVHTVAESHAAGLGLLVRDRDHQALFRLRVIGDSYSVEAGASVVFELGRVP